MRKFLNIIKRVVRKLIRIIRLLLFKVQQFISYLTGNYVECNICHHKAFRMKSDNWHLYCICPNCSAGVRQRLLMASLSSLDKFSFDNIIKNKSILHFSPHKSLLKVIQNAAGEYKTADFFAEGYHYDDIDYNIDISDMKSIKNESFDCVIACDVLEHVPDHIGGIKEVYRILKKDGYCIFTVPQKDNLKETFEDFSITGKKEREKAFGQWDHLRIYGDDFVDMLERCGFEVTSVDENFFDKKIAKHFVLFPPVLSKHPLATNYRKVFFGKKK